MIDEIRAIRRQIWREHGNDIERVVQHYMELQRQYKGPVISDSPPAAPKQDKSAA
ncbi:MAG TPA: hypothetical protein VGO40_18705 [Longimicrobium sp.]|nr:hypothetical protein [Longimicrobium sp.]